MRTAMSQMQLSARAYHRVLKLARTIGDFTGAEQIVPPILEVDLEKSCEPPRGIFGY